MIGVILFTAAFLCAVFWLIFIYGAITETGKALAWMLRQVWAVGQAVGRSRTNTIVAILLGIILCTIWFWH